MGIGAVQQQGSVCSMLVASLEQLQLAAVVLDRARGTSIAWHLVRELESIVKWAHMVPGKQWDDLRDMDRHKHGKMILAESLHHWT